MPVGTLANENADTSPTKGNWSPDGISKYLSPPPTNQVKQLWNGLGGTRLWVGGPILTDSGGFQVLV